MKKRFLVLGSNSFSGSNFINFLLKKNCEVVGISRSNEYNEIYLPYKKSLNLKSFKFYKIDINKDLNKILQVVKKFKPKYVVNYIAQGMVSESWKNPEHWYNTNIVSQTRLYKYLSGFKFISDLFFNFLLIQPLFTNTFSSSNVLKGVITSNPG